MPARFHTVAPAVWDATMSSLSLEAQLVRLYVMTCPSRNSEGLFQLKLGYVIEDTRLDRDTVERALLELEGLGLVAYDPSAQVVLDRTALAFAPLRNGRDKDGKVARVDKRIPGAVRQFEGTPSTPLKGEFLELTRMYSPDLYYALIEAMPELTIGRLAGESLSPIEGASAFAAFAEGPSANSEAPSRARPIRDEEESPVVRTSPSALDSASDSDLARSDISCGNCRGPIVDFDWKTDRAAQGRPVCHKCAYADVPF